MPSDPSSAPAPAYPTRGRTYCTEPVFLTLNWSTNGAPGYASPDTVIEEAVESNGCATAGPAPIAVERRYPPTIDKAVLLGVHCVVPAGAGSNTRFRRATPPTTTPADVYDPVLPDTENMVPPLIVSGLPTRLRRTVGISRISAISSAGV